MSLKPEKDKVKQLQDKCQSVLTSLLRDEDNKYCVDCDSKGPRWASWNIGVFLCIRCAGIHRNLGVHISKVKSVNLDAWTPEQVVSLQQMGNSRARAVYEANLPDNFRRPQSDSSLESFIRAKYEHKKYIAREWVAPPLPKVNWEKEIDEEIEKQKRKKKTTLEKKPLANVEVPQLPKPTNPSPKPTRSATNTPEVKEKHKHSSDLLGINGEDSFSNFISATPLAVSSNPEEPSKPPEAENVKSEEESFFNQALPVEKEKTKLDKDSILALYGSAPTMPQFQVPFQASAFQAQVPPAQQPSFQGFGSFPQGSVSSFPAQNGGPSPSQFVQQTNGGFQNWNKGFSPAQTQNQFMPNQFAQPAQFQNGQSNQFQNGVPNTAQFTAAFPPQFAANPPQPPIGNAPFANNGLFNNQSMNLQQQFGNMVIGGSTPAPAPTNIWQ